MQFEFSDRVWNVCINENVRSKYEHLIETFSMFVWCYNWPGEATVVLKFTIKMERNAGTALTYAIVSEILELCLNNRSWSKVQNCKFTCSLINNGNSSIQVYAAGFSVLLLWTACLVCYIFTSDRIM